MLTDRQVFKADRKNPETGKIEVLALKKLNPVHETEGFPITALREIMHLKKLNQPNIVRLTEIEHSRRKVKF